MLAPGTVKGGKSAVVQFFRFRVNDAGADGVTGNGDDAMFLQQGLSLR